MAPGRSCWLSVSVWRGALRFPDDQVRRFSHRQTIPTKVTTTTATKAAVTMRVKTTDCTNSSAACKPKNRLRLLAQWSMCEANAAVSVDTKSAAGFANAVGVLEVVMVCSVCVKKGNFAALFGNKICAFQPYFYPTQLPLVYPSDAAAVDVGLELCAGLVMIKRDEQALCMVLYI